MSLIPSRPSRNHHYARWLSLLCSNSCPQFGASTRASLVAQTVKNLSAMQETQVWSLGWEDPLQTGIATHSSILAWRIPWTEEPGWPQCMGSQRVRHNWVTISLSLSHTHTHTHTMSEGQQVIWADSLSGHTPTEQWDEAVTSVWFHLTKSSTPGKSHSKTPIRNLPG